MAISHSIPTAPAKEETELCISCLGPNAPGTNFCQHCRTPLTSYAATGPLERVYALGDFARKGLRHPKRSIRFSIGLFCFLLVVAVLFGMMLP